MLFDLRGSGRRTTVKVVYVTLAHPDGRRPRVLRHRRRRLRRPVRRDHRPDSGATPARGRSASAPTQAAAKAEATPQDAAAWAEAARARYQLARVGRQLRPERGPVHRGRQARSCGSPTATGRSTSRSKPKEPDDSVARMMVQAYAHRASTTPPRRSRRRRSSPRHARSRRPSPTSPCSPTRRARPARATSRPSKALELADPDHRETLKAELEESQATGAGHADPERDATPTADAQGRSRSRQKQNSDTQDVRVASMMRRSAPL